MTTLLEFNDLHYCHPGAQIPALSGASLRLCAGQKVALLGRNGSGKTTLLLHGNGLLRPDRGSVRIAGELARYDRRGLLALRSHVGLVFQNPDDQLFSASVAQDISFGPLNLGLSKTQARERVESAAALCDVTDLLDRPTHALSGGQKTRVALAGVLAMEPRVLLADEALAGLDPWMQHQALSIFDRLAARGVPVVLSTHDLDLARQWPDVVAIMAAGQVVAADTPQRVFADPTMRAALGPPELWSGRAVQGPER
jgi:cobalt/nickel transport system ATP-binding protein